MTNEQKKLIVNTASLNLAHIITPYDDDVITSFLDKVTDRKLPSTEAMTKCFVETLNEFTDQYENFLAYMVLHYHRELEDDSGDESIINAIVDSKKQYSVEILTALCKALDTAIAEQQA